MKKKTKQSTSSIPEDTIPLLSEHESDLEESKTFNPKKAAKSPTTPSKGFLHTRIRSKSSAPTEDTIPLLSEYEGDFQEFKTSSPKVATKSPVIPNIPKSSISYEKLKNEDDAPAKKAVGSSSGSSLSSDSGVGASASSSKISVRKGIKSAIKKTIAAFDKNVKRERASSSEQSSSASDASSATWYVNPLDVSDSDSEPGQIKHWAPVEDLLDYDEFDAFARSRLSSTSASSDFEFRTGEQYYGAIDRESDSVVEPIYETIDPHWRERANVAPEPAYDTPRNSQIISQNAATKAEPVYDTPRNSQLVGQAAAATAEPAYDTPRNSQLVGQSDKVELIYDAVDPQWQEYANVTKAEPVYDTPRNSQLVGQNAAAKAEPVYDTPRNSQILAQQRPTASKQPAGDTRAVTSPVAAPRRVLDAGEQKSSPAPQNVSSAPIAQQPAPAAQAVSPTPRTAARETRATTSAAKPAVAPKPAIAPKPVAAPALNTGSAMPSVQQRKAMLAEKTGQVTEAGSQSPQRSTQSESAARETRTTTPAAKPAVASKPVAAPALNTGSAMPSVQQRKAMLAEKTGQVTEAGLQSPQRPTQSESAARETRTTTPAAKPAIAPAAQAVSPTPRTTAATSANLMAAQPFRGAAATLKSVTPPVAAPRRVLDAGEQKSSPAPQNASSAPIVQQTAPATRAVSPTPRTAAATSANLMAAQPFRGAAATLKSVTPPVAAPRRVLDAGEQKSSPTALQNMGSVPEYSKNVVPSVRQRKAMLSEKVGSVTEAGSQSPQRSTQSESAARETRTTTPAAKPAVAPKPAIAPKPAAAPALNTGSAIPGVQQRKAMLSEKTGQVTEAGSQSPQRSTQSESAAREIQGIRTSSAQTRESRAEFASRLNTLLANRNAFMQEASKAEKPKVRSSASKPSTPASAPAQIDFNELKNKAAEFSAALEAKARAEQKAPTVSSSVAPPSTAAKKSVSVHESVNSKNPAFVDELQKVLSSKIGSSQIEKPATASKTSAKQAPIQKHGDATESRTTGANAHKVSKISANPAFAGAIPTLERMLAERQAVQQAERTVGSHPGTQRTLGGGISYSDMISTERQSAPSMGNPEAAGKKSPASAEKEGRAASASLQKDGEAQAKKGKHVSSLIRGFESSSTTPVKGAAR